MADVKISELNGASTPLAGTELVPLVQNGETKKVAVSEIGVEANPTSGILPVNENGVFVDSVVSQTGTNVGIGTTSPSTALHVVGAITVNDGNNNTKVGTNAGLSYTGNNQSAFGYYAGRNNIGADQSAFGYNAGGNNIGGNQSSFGINAGFSNAGANQTVVGASAGRNNTGANQSAFGYLAGRNNTGANNSNFGYFSGYYLSDGTTVNTASSDSVFLGSNTKALGASQTNQIVIGYNATGIGANSVTLGNDSIVTTALKGNVGIGTTSPTEKLDVNGTVKALGYKSSDGSAGVTQNVNTGGGNTLVIKNGIITQVI